MTKYRKIYKNNQQAGSLITRQALETLETSRQ